MFVYEVALQYKRILGNQSWEQIIKQPALYIYN